MKKIACLFPGIGYTCDKPLLYYSRELLRSRGWETVPLSWSGLDREQPGEISRTALEQAEKALKAANWDGYDRILFIGKSLGTVVCTEYAARHGLRCRQILFTPVEDTFRFADRHSVVFHGTVDPWMKTETVRDSCRRLDIPLYEVEGANHSLETGDAEKDIRELRKIIKTVREFMEQKGE